MELDLQAVVSRRVQQSLQERGWSHSQLVYAMQKAGTPLDKSAISRSLSGARDWKLNELPALAKALEVPLTEMIVDPEVWASEKAKRLILRWARKVQEAADFDEQHMEALYQAEEIFDELRGLLRYENDARPAVMQALIHYSEQRGVVKSDAARRRMASYQLFRLTEDPEYSIGIEDMLPRNEHGDIVPPKGHRRPQ